MSAYYRYLVVETHRKSAEAEREARGNLIDAVIEAHAAGHCDREIADWLGLKRLTVLRLRHSQVAS